MIYAAEKVTALAWKVTTRFVHFEHSQVRPRSQSFPSHHATLLGRCGSGAVHVLVSRSTSVFTALLLDTYCQLSFMPTRI